MSRGPYPLALSLTETGWPYQQGWAHMRKRERAHSFLEHAPTL